MILIITDLATDYAMQVSFGLCVLFCVYCFIGSLITGNCSQVDRLWSVIPAVYAWLFVYFEYSLNGFSSYPTKFRVIAMAVLVTLWSLRLTFNYWRKDGYKAGVEDYRWEQLRKILKYPQRIIPFQLFNLFFIAIYQNILIFSFVLPVYYVHKHARTTPINILDAVSIGLFLFFLAIETIADQQQWNYQCAKYKYLETKKYDNQCGYTEAELKQGFLTKGLFAYSRHPNFFAEQSIWWVLYLFTLAASFNGLLNGNLKLLYNHSIVGTVLLTLLFQGSTMFTEKLTIAKYPAYKNYQKAVSRLIPLWPSQTKVN